MTRGEADVLTYPTAPCAPASAARGGVAILDSAADGGVTPLHRQPVVGSPSSCRQPVITPRLHGPATSYKKAGPKCPGRAEAPQPTYRAHHDTRTA
jgi:hypothetical protein